MSLYFSVSFWNLKSSIHPKDRKGHMFQYDHPTTQDRTPGVEEKYKERVTVNLSQVVYKRTTHDPGSLPTQVNPVKCLLTSTLTLSESKISLKGSNTDNKVNHSWIENMVEKIGIQCSSFYQYSRFIDQIYRHYTLQLYQQ